MAKPVVTVIGLGAMGHAFAANLLKNGFTTHAYNRTKSRGEDLLSAGIILHDSASEAVKEADVVITMLVNGEMTIATVNDFVGELKPNAVIAQMATIGPDATLELEKMIQSVRPDVVLIDAPVSGTKKPAEDATLSILASGEHDKAKGIDDVFAAISKKATWLGAVGNGSKMKLVVNGWLIGLMQGAAESLQLAEAFGFTPDDFWAALEGGPLAAPYVKAKINMIDADDYTPQMQLFLAVKDAKLALDAIGDKAKMPSLAVTTELWGEVMAAGLDKEDLAIVYKYLKEHK